MTTSPRLGTRLVRDRLTLVLYGPYIVWGWYLYSFSPAVPLIATELGVSRALAGLHGTAMAAGTVTTGLISYQVAARLGRRLQAVAGVGSFLVGAAVLMIATVLPATLAATLFIGIGGGLMLTASTPALSLHHGAAGPAAVTEANGIGAAVGLLAPLVLGLFVNLGWGWRPAVAIAAALAIAVAALLLRIPTTTTALGKAVRRPRGDGPKEGFGAPFWFFWTAIICGAAIEFGTVYWAPDLLASRAGASESVASAAVSALVAGLAVSRFVVGPLSLRKAPEKLLLVGYAVALVGWATFWLTESTAVAVAGLVIAGLGYGTHFPLAVSLVLRASGDRLDQGQARGALGAGGAIGLAPFALGALADAVGPHRAFLLIGALIMVGGTVVALGLRAVHRGVRTAAVELL